LNGRQPTPAAPDLAEIIRELFSVLALESAARIPTE